MRSEQLHKKGGALKNMLGTALFCGRPPAAADTLLIENNWN